MSDQPKQINTYYENVRRIISLHVTPAARIVFVYLLDRQGKNEDAWPGIDTIQKECFLSRQTIITALHILSGEPDPMKKDKKPGEAYIKKILPKAHSKYRISNSYKILKDESGLIFVPVSSQSKNCTKPVEKLDRSQSKNCTKPVEKLDPNVSVNNKVNDSKNDLPPVSTNVLTSPKGKDSACGVVKDRSLKGEYSIVEFRAQYPSGNSNPFDDSEWVKAYRRWGEMNPDQQQVEHIMSELRLKKASWRWSRENYNGFFIDTPFRFLGRFMTKKKKRKN